MLDKTLNAHLDKMDILEEEAIKDINKLIDKLNIDAIIKEPTEAMMEIVEKLKEIIVDKYAPRAVENGLEIAKTLSKLKRDVKIQKTDNPELNKDD